MKRKDLGLHSGGLFRCCLHTAAEWVEDDPETEAEEGQRIECESEHKVTMKVERGVIRWTGDE